MLELELDRAGEARHHRRRWIVVVRHWRCRRIKGCCGLEGTSGQAHGRDVFGTESLSVRSEEAGIAETEQQSCKVSDQSIDCELYKMSVCRILQAPVPSRLESRDVMPPRSRARRCCRQANAQRTPASASDVSKFGCHAAQVHAHVRYSLVLSTLAVCGCVCRLETRFKCCCVCELASAPASSRTAVRQLTQTMHRTRNELARTSTGWERGDWTPLDADERSRLNSRPFKRRHEKTPHSTHI